MVAHANDDHTALLAAVRQRDLQAALRVEAAHLEWARSRWMDSVREADPPSQEPALRRTLA